MIHSASFLLDETISWRGAGDIVSSNDGLFNVTTVFVEFYSEITEIG